MRIQTRRAQIARQLVALAAAVALPASGLILAAGAEERADAAEIDVHSPAAGTFERAAPSAIAPSPQTVPDILDEAGAEASSPASVTGEPAEELGSGIASFYGSRFAGRPTASGERFDPGGLTAAHRTLPFGSMVRVTDDRTGKSVTVRINDRGPFHGERIIDLSREAARQIGLIQRGRATVRLALLAD